MGEDFIVEIPTRTGSEQVNFPARGATGDYSKGPDASEGPPTPFGWASAALLVLAFLAIVLLVAAAFSTVIEIRVGGVVVDSIKGHDRHGYALLLIAIAASPMAVGAVLGESRPAAWAVVLLGAIALGITLIGDLPDLHAVGQYKARFEDAAASGRLGFWFELLGSLGLAGAGAGWLWLGRATPREKPPAPAPEAQPPRRRRPAPRSRGQRRR